MKQQEWNGFVPGVWEDEIDVRGFIQKNYTPYEGDGSFLSGPTQRTREVREKFEDLLRQEREAWSPGIFQATPWPTATPAAPPGIIAELPRNPQEIVLSPPHNLYLVGKTTANPTFPRIALAFFKSLWYNTHRDPRD